MMKNSMMVRIDDEKYIFLCGGNNIKRVLEFALKSAEDNSEKEDETSNENPESSDEDNSENGDEFSNEDSESDEDNPENEDESSNDDSKRDEDDPEEEGSDEHGKPETTVCPTTSIPFFTVQL
nr:protein SIEVE ELEMENT OCCLUSION B-like [Ipomoea batatas]